MNVLYTILIVLASATAGLSQVPDTTCFDNTQLVRIYNRIDSLSQLDSLRKLTILHQNLQLNYYTQLNQQNEQAISLQTREIQALTNLLQHNINLTSNLNNPPKWYEHKVVYFLTGAVTIYAAAHIVSLVR